MKDIHFLNESFLKKEIHVYIIFKININHLANTPLGYVLLTSIIVF